jgi:hypothetical protein
MMAVLIFPLYARGDSATGHSAVVTRLKGSAVIFTNAQGSANDQAHQVNFEGENYFEHSVKQGSKLGKGDVIQTAADSQVRLIFKNGDSLSVGPATSYKINWGKDDSAPMINIFYGKVRGIFKKDGPRTGTVVQTKSSVMGVRGTDFCVTAAGSTAVSVLRGEVNLRANKAGAKEVALQTGFTAKIEAPAAKIVSPVDNSEKSSPTNPSTSSTPKVAEAPEQEIVVSPTTKTELVEIQTKSTIKPPVQAEGLKLASVDEENLKEVAELEKQATETVMSDIKVTDPVLYSQISENKKVGQDMDNVNTLSVGELFKKAPEEKKDSKPGAKELEGLGNDAYDRYFRIE